VSQSGIFPTDEWVSVSNDPDGKPIFLRFRSGEPLPDRKQEFTALIVVRWKFDAHDETGLPDQTTLAHMNQFEERIFDACDREGTWGSGVAVITTAGQREWRLYAPSVDLFMSNFNSELAGLGPYPLDIQAFEDAEWKGLEDIRSAVG